MKKLFVILMALALLCGSFSLAENVAGEEYQTLQGWLEAKGDCGSCRMKVTVLEVLNPVLALVGDGTGTVNLFGITVNGEFSDFITLELGAGDVLELENPRYNEFEGTVEMADSILLNHTRVQQVTVQEWVEAKGDCQPCKIQVTIIEMLNPVLALVGDGTGTVNLFGVTLKGEFTDFETLGLTAGDSITLANPVYNEFEGNIEMASSILGEVVKAEQALAE